jgi:glycosyltransferase involved in cell wall biosynthesis
MNVLIVTRSFVREVGYLARYVDRAGLPIKFCLVMPYTEKHDELLPASVAVRKLYFTERMRATCYAPSLFWDIQAFRPDILHIFEEFSGLIAFQSLLFNKLLRRKSKVMVYSAENLRNNMHVLFRIPMRYVARRSDLAFVCSHGVKQVLEEEGYPKPIEVFPLGVDTTKFYNFPAVRLKSKLNLDEKFVLGYTGRLLGIKGVFLLIEMMRYLPENVHLLMIGTGPEEQHLRNAVADYRLEQRVHFIGKIPYTQLPQYMNCMDIAIVPSLTTTRWKEQFGRVIVESMSCEVPVIGSNSGSIPEVVGKAGLIFPEHDLQELVNVVNTLLQHPEIRHELGRYGRERAVRLYSTDIMCERFLAMYKTLMTND